MGRSALSPVTACIATFCVDETGVDLTHRDDLGLGSAAVAAILASDPELVTLVDEQGRIVWVNGAVTTVLGWEPEQFLHVGPHLRHPDDLLLGATDVERILGVDGAWHDFRAIRVPLDDGRTIVRYRWPQASAPLPAAVLDEVTSLPNRLALRRALEQRLHRESGAVAVLFCDLDGFKGVNDRLGHEAGDAVLREVAVRLRSRLRNTEVIGRWGGDEFVVVVDVPGPALAATVAARLRSSIIDRPFAAGDGDVVLGISIGVALAQPGEDGAMVIAAADSAMYEAKRSGTGIVTAARAA